MTFHEKKVQKKTFFKGFPLVGEESLVEGYVDGQGIGHFDSGEEAEVAMMAGGTLIGVDRLPANILDDGGDDMQETTAIDIR